MRVGGGFVRICRITFFVACFWGCYLPDQDKRRATLRTSIISLVLETWDQCGQFVEYVIILPITPTAFRGESLATKCSMLTLVWWLSKHKHFLIVQAIYVMQKVFQAIFLPDGSSLVHATFPSMAATPLTIWCTHSPPNSILPSSLLPSVHLFPVQQFTFCRHIALPRCPDSPSPLLSPSSFLFIETHVVVDYGVDGPSALLLCTSVTFARSFTDWRSRRELSSSRELWFDGLVNRFTSNSVLLVIQTSIYRIRQINCCMYKSHRWHDISFKTNISNIS